MSFLCTLLSTLVISVSNVYLIIALIIIQGSIQVNVSLPILLIVNEQVNEKCLVKYSIIMLMGFTFGLTYFNSIQFLGASKDWRLSYFLSIVVLNGLCFLMIHYLVVESPSYTAQFNQRDSIALLNYIAEVNGEEKLDEEEFIYNLESNYQFTMKDLLQEK